MATTIEHAPPIAMFDQKQRPKGYEFPACLNCNNGSAKLDLVASMFISISADAYSGVNSNPHTYSLMQGVANNYPDVISYIGTDDREVREVALVADDRTIDLLSVPINRRIFRKWLNPWLAKQSAALWYSETGQIAGQNDRISVRWLSSEQIVSNGIPEPLIESLTNIRMMRTGRRGLPHLFSYRYAISEDRSFGAFLLNYRNAVVGFSVIAPREMMVAHHRILGMGDLYAPRAGFGLERCLELPLADV